MQKITSYERFTEIGYFIALYFCPLCFISQIALSVNWHEVKKVVFV